MDTVMGCSEKEHVFYVFYLQINVFNIYATGGAYWESVLY